MLVEAQPLADAAVQPVNPNKALWEKGDFTRIAATMRQSGEELVDTLGITPGMKILDLGCGDGTLVAQILKISAAYTPPPPAGFISPMTWGDEAIVRQRFEAAGIAPGGIGFERVTWHFRQPGPPIDLLATFRYFYGPTMNAFDAARKDGREPELARELETLFESQNRATSGTDIGATFLKVTVIKA